MPWVKLDDGFADHPKIHEVGPIAAWLHVAALCYCARHLTDGRVPTRVVRGLIDTPRPRVLVDKLVSSGLWDAVEGGYEIHDYLDYQPSRERVLAEREAAAERQRRRRNGSRHAVTDPVTSAVTDPVTSDGGHAVSSASPTRPDPYPPQPPPTQSAVTPTPEPPSPPNPEEDNTEPTDPVEAAIRLALNTEHACARDPIRNRPAWERTLRDSWYANPDLNPDLLHQIAHQLPTEYAADYLRWPNDFRWPPGLTHGHDSEA